MKTPEEIKKGLECCLVCRDYRDCLICSYGKPKKRGVLPCECEVKQDILAYIQQLERERDEARNDLDTLNYANTELYSAYNAMKRERDAAVDELSMLARGFGDECYSCRFAEFTPEGHECKRAEIIAEETGEEVEGGTLICKWEWKGL